ncbi:MAG: YdcF family protein, partial [Oxalobacteraceae bacterium]
MRPVVVIFGAAVRPDGSASGVMRARVAAALATGRRLMDPIYMPTGGQGRFGPAEATVMTELLVEAGIERGSIVPEQTAVNTLRSAL